MISLREDHNSLPLPAEELIATMHHPGGIPRSAMVFDEVLVAGLVIRWQKTTDENEKTKLWQQIVIHSLTMITCIIRKHKFDTQLNIPIHEAINIQIPKLFRACETFDPERGRLFTLISITVIHSNLSLLTRRDTRYRCELQYAVTETENEIIFERCTQPIYPEDFVTCLRKWIKTRFTHPKELKAQRWIFELLMERPDAALDATVYQLVCLFAFKQCQARALVQYMQIKIRTFAYQETHGHRSTKRFFRFGRIHESCWEQFLNRLSELVDAETYNKVLMVCAGQQFEFGKHDMRDLQNLKTWATDPTPAKKPYEPRGFKELIHRDWNENEVALFGDGANEGAIPPR
jgi:hypothetical protein